MPALIRMQANSRRSRRQASYNPKQQVTSAVLSGRMTDSVCFASTRSLAMRGEFRGIRVRSRKCDGTF